MQTTKTLTISGQRNDLNDLATPFQNTEHAALAYAEAGLSVLPLNQDKSPALPTWKEYQSTIASTDRIHRWYSSAPMGIGIVCGSVSKNIECLDIDEKYNVDPVSLLDQLNPLLDVQASGLLSRLVHEISQNGGHHFVYRCKSIEGNLKLALRPTNQIEKEASIREKQQALRDEGKSDQEIEEKNIKPQESMTLIETRGEGGYFACYPTPGYTLISGSFTDIPEITEEERRILFECAKSLNRFTEEQKKVNGYPKKRTASIVRPGDDFNDRGDIRPVLKENGWKLVYTTKQNVQHWRRPGKKDGVSATFGREPNMFYVFSSNCSPLEPNTWYTKFALLALLSFNGNFADAAKDLAEQGYGATVVAEAETFLNKFYDFRFNTVTGRAVYREKGSACFRTLDEYDLNSIHRKLHLSHIPIGIDHFARLMKSEFTTPFDPFKEYFDGLEPWDQKTDYIAQLAGTVQLKDPSEQPLFETFLRKWLVAAVGCAIDPKISNHNCLILVGDQGIYKSTWINGLVPSALSEYLFVGTIDPGNKDSIIHISECFLINLDELETLRKDKMGDLKSMITMERTRGRRPYERFTEQMIRRSSFAGSINNNSFLADETGSRRFLVFEVTMVHMNHGIDMDRVYAQAHFLFKSGFRYWLDQRETAMVNSRNKKFSTQTTEDELVAQYCIPDQYQWKTATEVAEKMAQSHQYPLRSASARNFGYALKRADFRVKKTGGTSYYAVEVTDSYRFHMDTGGVTGGVQGEVESEYIEGETVETDLN